MVVVPHNFVLVGRKCVLRRGCRRTVRGIPQRLQRWTCGVWARSASNLTLFPLIRPGSLVQIDATQRKIVASKWKTEFDRPIYFVELRSGYVCSWCQVDHGQLMVIPHPHSHQDVKRFDYPSQAEIVGRVTGVAMRIVTSGEPSGGLAGPVLK